MHPLIPPECRMAFELSCRNDGYLMADLDSPVLETLRRAGLVYTRPTATQGYVIVRAVQEPQRRVFAHGSRYADRKRWARSESMGEMST